MTEIAPIITALAVFVTATAGVIIAIRQGHARRIAYETRADIERVHLQVNSNLAEVKRELSVQNRRWDALIRGLGQHPDAARIFAELVNGSQEEEEE